jgi:hypothetical protein
MKSRSWPSAFATACAIISALPLGAQTPPAPSSPTPAIAVVDPSDAPQWQTWVKELGWKVVSGAAADNPDVRALALAAAVREAITNGADPARVYLAGRGAASAAVFYALSRLPDVFAAAVAVEGSPQPAIDTGRLYAANFRNAPVLWITKDPADAKHFQVLNITWKSAAGLAPPAVLDWLAQHRREAFPSEIDCETNSPQFARCFWIEMTKFDPAERNDVLASTRVEPTVTPALDLGGFGYKPDEPGPGILVSYLPEKYNGPLKLNDRIMAVDGRPIETPQRYLEMMAKYTESHPAVVTVQRGKDRVRLETFVVVPKREAGVTARVQGQWIPADREIQIISRTVKEMKVNIPAEWADSGNASRLLWNGLALEKIERPGCVLLTVEKELLRAGKCE